MNLERLDELFAAIDRRDAAAFASFMSPDGVFRFAGQAPVVGRDAVESAVAAFFAAIGGIHHEVGRAWSLPGALVCEGRVTYTRLDDTTLEVPFANVLKLTDGLVGEYLVFVDAHALFV
jgi:ketosteroid isomerase-like protein